MKHVFLLLAFLITGTVPLQAQTPISDSNRLSKEQVLAHVDELKELIDEKIWPTYNDPAYSMEMNYYGSDGVQFARDNQTSHSKCKDIRGMVCHADA